MSLDEHTPTRSAKRRKITTGPEASGNGSAAEATPPPASTRSLRNRTKRRLFESTTEASNADPEHVVTNTDEQQRHDNHGNGTEETQTPKNGRNGSSKAGAGQADEDSHMTGTDAESEGIGLRSSGRQRRRPRRFSNELEDAIEVKKSATKATRSRVMTPNSKEKEVGISDSKTESIGKELGFKDIDGSAKRKGGRRRARAVQDESAQDEHTGEAENGSTEAPAVLEELTTPKKSRRKTKEAATKQIEQVDAAVEAGTDQSEIPVEIPELLDPAPIQQLPPVATDTEDVDDETRTAFAVVQQIVLSKVSGRKRVPLVALEEEFRKVQHVAEQTVTAGEGNSMLIIGPRGSGKTAMIEAAVAGLERSHKDEFHVIRLSGFLQTDDRLALREIWRQLGREMDTEDDTSKVSSYADTMASLLALLSHPEELSGDVEVGVTTKSVIFIIDEFDLFATHPRQTLLYNLFDIAQARKAPIAVFGLSTKVDVAEHLEKRVKSRFSHRYVYLPLAKNLPIFTDMCMSALKVHDDEIEGNQSDHILNAQRLWNQHVESLLTTSSMATHLRRHYTLTKSLPLVLSTFLLPLSQTIILPSNLLSATDILKSASSLLPPDSLLASLPQLPTLSLSLLIAASRLDVLLGTPQCNFNMAYHEYVSLCSRSRVQSSALGAVASAAATRVWGRDIARGCWEKLEDGGWIVPSGEGKGGEGREERMYRVDVRLEEIEAACGGEQLGRVERSWCREL